MKFCAQPGCPNKVTIGRCDAHRRQVDQRRGTARARGYSRRWEARAAAFRQKYPLCGMRPGGQVPVMSQCYTQGDVTAGDLVDHVTPHKGDQGLFWDEAGNWQTLCTSCHGRKTQAGL